MEATRAYIQSALDGGNYQSVVEFHDLTTHRTTYLFGYVGNCSRAHAEMVAQNDAKLFGIPYAGEV